MAELSDRKFELSVRKFDTAYRMSYTSWHRNYFSNRENRQNQPGKYDYPGMRPAIPNYGGSAMPKEVKAIYAYTPRVKLERRVELPTLVSYIEGRTGFNRGAIMAMLSEFSNALVFFGRSGHPVRLPDMGIFAPRIDKIGRFGINFKMDKHLKSEMNAPGKFTGKVVNRDMIGKPVEEMVERWNTDHPDDKIKTKKRNK